MHIRQLCRLGLPLLAAWTLALPSAAATLTRTSAFTYDPATGLLTKEIIEPDTSNLCLVTEYTYDGYGNKVVAGTRNCNGSTAEAAAPSGDPTFAARSTSNTMDARGQFPLTTTNAIGQSETKTFNANYGTVASLTGPNGLSTQWQYDGFGRKIKEIRADGTQTKWDYLYCTGINGGSANCPTIAGAAGAWVLVTTPLASDGTTQTGPISKTYYDALNREIRSETQGYDGNGTSTPIYKDTQYDSLGRPYKVSRPYYAGQTVYWATVTYDALSRVIQETQPDGNTTTTSYNGLTVSVTNPNNQTRSSTKNSQGQVVSVTDAQGKQLTYAYDPFGNLTQTTDALGNIVTLSYDLRGRKIQMQDPDMGTWSYAYDALGQLVKQTDAKGQTSTLAYDKLGRMTNRSEADLISNWYYDQYKDGSACNKGIGKLCQSETSTGYNRSITYDSLGRSSSSATTLDVPTPYSASLTYDANGRVTSQTYPTGLVVSYSYTALGYLKDVRNAGTNALYWQANSLDAEGHLLQQTYGNGVQTTQSYNASNGRITAIQAGAGNAVQNLAYQYDNLGNITSRSDANQSLSETFVYDSLNRITSATVNSSGAGIQTQSFAYDALGNITSKSDVGSYAYPASGATSQGPHAVSSITLSAGGSISFTYDANGNRATTTQVDASNATVAAKSRAEFYTSFNMPQSLGQGSTSAAFYYGPEHQRVKQLSSAQGATIYLNPGNNGDLFYEKDIKPDNSIEERNFITAGGQTIAIVKYTTQSSTTTITTRYMHRDNLGSVTTVTDETGNPIERLAYEPFGKRRFPNGNTDPNGTITPQNTDRGFTGHEELDEVGLIHMNGRIYDPLVGRFSSADPQIQAPGNLQSYNRYSYGFNSPLNGSDPSGYGWLSDLVHAVDSFARNPSPRHAFNLIHNLPGQGTVDKQVMNSPVLFSIGQGVATYFTLAFCGGCGGAMWTQYYTYQATGSMNEATKAGAIVLATQYAFYQVGEWTGHNPSFNTMKYYENVAGHMAVGCASAAASGGNCGSGAMSAGFGAAVAPAMRGMPEQYGVIASAVVGGTASVLGGGKFTNGAVTAAFGYMFNQMAAKSCLGSSSVMCQSAPSQADREATRARGDAVQPVIVEDLALGGVGIVRTVARGAISFFEGAYYSEKVLLQATESGFHGFPQSADGFAAAYGKLTVRMGDDGAKYQWLTLPGEYMGRSGTFEYVKDGAGRINHRFFNPN